MGRRRLPTNQDKMGEFGNKGLISREGIRWVYDNLAAFVEFLWGGGGNMQGDELLVRTRVNRKKLLQMKLVKDEYGAVANLDLHAVHKAPVLNKILIPVEKKKGWDGSGWQKGCNCPLTCGISWNKGSRGKEVGIREVWWRP